MFIFLRNHPYAIERTMTGPTAITEAPHGGGIPEQTSETAKTSSETPAVEGAEENSESGPTSIVQSPSYLTRKARKHHSMTKNRKGTPGSNMFRSLMCGSNTTTGSQEEDEENKNDPAYSSPSSASHNHQSSCTSMALDTLADSLPAQDYVRETIQRGVRDSLSASTPLGEKVGFTNSSNKAFHTRGSPSAHYSTPTMNQEKAGTMESFFPSTMKYWQQLTSSKTTPFKSTTPGTSASRANVSSHGSLTESTPTSLRDIGNATISTPLMERQIQQAVAKAQQETREQLAQESAQDWQQEHSKQLKQIKENYQRQLAERKDQVILANRLLRTKEEEIERLEQELKESNKQVYLDTIRDLKNDKTELELKLKTFQEQEALQTMKPSQQLEQVQNELQMERELSLARQQELDKVQEQLEKIQNDYSKSLIDTEQLKVDIETLVFEKDEAIREYDNLHAEYFDMKPDTVKDLEIQKLREQIIKLENQSMQTHEEHSKALAELKEQQQREVEEITRELEQKMLDRTEQERELQAKLSESSLREKEELLERIEELEEEKRMERSGGLREVQKKEGLLEKIDQLEQRQRDLTREHERALWELRESNAQELLALQRELEQEQDRSVAKEREYVVAIQENSSFEKEELCQKIDLLQTQLEAERNTTSLLQMKLTNYQDKIDSLHECHQEEVGQLRAHTSAEIERLKVRLESTGISVNGPLPHATENELREVVATLENELEELRASNQTRISELEAQHSESLEQKEKEFSSTLEKVRSEAESKLQSLRSENEVRVKELETKLSDANSMTKDKEQLFEEALENEKALKKQIEDLEQQIANLRENEVSLKKKIQDLETKLQNDASSVAIRVVEEELETSKRTYENQLLALKSQHSKELDEILAQLDLVEQEHKEKIASVVQEKENLITALSSQMAKAVDKSENLEKENIGLLSELEDLRNFSKTAQDEVELLTAELKDMSSKHDLVLKATEKEKEKACQTAREEMIKEAEIQFKHANELYVKLKKQYDVVKSKADKFEKQVRSANEKAELAIKEKETLEYDLKSELAELKASSAKAEVEAARKAKEYRSELNKLIKSTETLEKQQEVTAAAKEDLESSLNRLMDERDNLRKTIYALTRENEELSKISEDLMSELEGR